MYLVTMAAAQDDAALVDIRVIERSTGKITGEMPYDGYGGYPDTARKDFCQVHWAPDSKSFALRIRDGRHSSKILWFQQTLKGDFAQASLPSATKEVHQLLKSTGSVHSYQWEQVDRWTDASTLVVQASGYIPNPNPGKELLSYKAEVTYNLMTKSIVNTRLIEAKPTRGI